MADTSTRRARRSFARSEDGTATIESVLWLPAIFGLLVLVADVSMVFNGQARMLRIVQDTNRSLSVGRLSTAAEAEAQIREKVADIDDNPVVDTVVDGGLIRTTLSIPVTKLDMLGWTSLLAGAAVTVVGEHYVEY